MRVVEGVGQLPREIEHLDRRDRARVQALGERLAVHQFHDQRPRHPPVLAGGFLQPVHGGDVRMGERGQQLRLALEAGHAVGIGSEGDG